MLWTEHQPQGTHATHQPLGGREREMKKMMREEEKDEFDFLSSLHLILLVLFRFVSLSSLISSLSSSLLHLFLTAELRLHGLHACNLTKDVGVTVGSRLLCILSHWRRAEWREKQRERMRRREEKRRRREE